MDRVSTLLEQARQLLRAGKEKEMIEVLKLAKAESSNNDYMLIQILNDLSGAYRNCGFYDKALEEIEIAISLLKKLNLSNSSQYAITLINKGNILRQKEDYLQAKYAFEKAKSILNALDKKDYAYVSLCNNYSLLYKAIGEYQRAYTLQREAIDILKTFSKHRLQLATSYNNLYAILILLKKYDEAEKSLLKAEVIYREIVGVKHPLYAALLNNLADLHIHKNEKGKALSLYELSLEIIRNSYGEKSEAFRTIKSNVETIKTSKKDDVNTPTSNLGNHHISGLERSKKLYYEQVEKLLKENYPNLLNQISVGLAGTGSQCLGFDDEISTDHDFETRLIICLPKNIYPTYVKKLKDLFKYIDGDIQITTADDFYASYIGYPTGPMTNYEWRKVPEDCFRTALNGHFFVNFNDEFSSTRNRLLKHYPEDIRIKKIAFCLNKIAQSGQYNYNRCLKRGDTVAANLSLAEFIQYYIRLMHLFNRVYTPFYKWAYRSMCGLKYLPKTAITGLKDLSSNALSQKEKGKLIEDMCLEIVEMLKENKLTTKDYDFLTYQATEVIKNIDNFELRNEDSWTE